MIRFDYDNGESCMIPRHIYGQYAKACRKQVAAHGRWMRCLIVGTKALWAKNSRLARRARIHDREQVYWHERMQCIVPYLPGGTKHIQPTEPTP